MKSPKFSIRGKLIIGFVGLALLVLMVVLIAVSRIVDNSIRENINSNFREAGKIFAQLQDVQFRQLRQTSTLVADMPYMKAAISTGDVVTVSSQIKQEVAPLLQFDLLATDSLSTELFSSNTGSAGLIMVFDRNGVPLGQLADSELPQRSITDVPGVQEALEGVSPEHSYIWKRDGSYFNVITIPVFIQDQIIAALSIGYPIRNFEAEMLAQLIEYEVSYYVDDQLLATSIESLSEENRMYLIESIRNSLTSNQEIEEGTTIDLEFENNRWLAYVLPMVDTSDESEITGYYLVAQSLTEALVPLRELQWVIFLIGLGGILIAVVIGVSLTNHLTKPINLLLRGIRRIENDEYDRPVEVVSQDEFGQLTRTFNKLVSNIEENLREKEALLSEIHHRVKNNLAVISGLLQLEQLNTGDDRTEHLLKNSQLRIHSMATVHELMYKAKNFNRLPFDEFVLTMVASIKEMYTEESSNIEVQYDVDNIKLNVNQAVPCGLIINELVTNAFKHAYPNGGGGTLKVSVKEKNEQVCLTISDNGVGFPEDVMQNKNGSLGFTLVEILTKQIEADLHFGEMNGTQISVVFNKDDKRGGSSTLRIE